MLNQNEILFKNNNIFIDKKNNLKNNEIEINDIINKYNDNNFNKLQVGIILNKDLDELFQNLFFKEIKELLDYKKDNIKKSEKNILELYLSIEKQYYENLYYTKLKDIKKKKEFSHKKFSSLIQYLISDKIKDKKKKKI